MRLIAPILKFRVLAMVLAIAIVSSLAYSYAASNLVAASSAGDGTQAITGYSMSNLQYTLDTINTNTIDQITFDLTPINPAGPPPDTVRILIGGSWRDCITLVNSVTCDLQLAPYILQGNGADSFRFVVTGG